MAQVWPDWRDRVRYTTAITLFLDFDGTLVRIASRPQEVRLTRQVSGVLRRLAAREGVWVVVPSGRPRAELAEYIKLPEVVLLGSHGYEMALPVEIIPLLQQAREVCVRGAADLERALQGYPGAWLELKPSGASMHYRQADPDRHREIAELVDHWHQAEPSRLQATILRPARKAVEIRPRADWGKGQAAQWWLETVGPSEARDSLVLVAGDDDTDEDMFRAFSESGFSVRVGGDPQATSARAWVESPDEVWEWLEDVESLRH
jgi:trehalose 6-phosphate phosphatase